MSNTTRIQFHLRDPIMLVDSSQTGANGGKQRLEPGKYELEEISNPGGAAAEGDQTWLVLVRDNKTTTLGAGLTKWRARGAAIN